MVNYKWIGNFPNENLGLFLYCPSLFSIHEKVNRIAIFWTGRPHSLKSCHFRGGWATCLPHKGGGDPLSALPKNTTSKHANLPTSSPRHSQNAERQARKLWISFFKVFWCDSLRRMNSKSTDCEADALATTASRRLLKLGIIKLTKLSQ